MGKKKTCFLYYIRKNLKLEILLKEWDEGFLIFFFK